MKKNPTSALQSIVLSFTLLVAGACATTKEKAPEQPQAPKFAKAELKDSKGKTVGTATLAETEMGVKISIQTQGLKAGEHGLHFHETGKCEGPKFTSAGNHFNPTSKEHGMKNPKGHHAGDLPNLKVEKSGAGAAEMTILGLTLSPGPNSLMKDGGTALVVHEKADDMKSGPSGNAGDRIACGVITAQ